MVALGQLLLALDTLHIVRLRVVLSVEGPLAGLAGYLDQGVTEVLDPETVLMFWQSYTGVQKI